MDLEIGIDNIGVEFLDLVIKYCFFSSLFQFGRRMRGGRRLWESKDDKKWGHDKFEEFSSQERHFDEVNDDLKCFMVVQRYL